MKRLSSFLLYMAIITIITMAGLYVSFLPYVEQRVYVVVTFLGISLAAGLIVGLALGLVHAKSRKAATTSLVLYLMGGVIASSVMFLDNTYIPDCKRRTIEKFRNTRDVALYDRWCLDEAARNAFLRIAEAEFDEKAFEALLEKGLQHQNPDCARLKFAIYDEDFARVKTMVDNGVVANCASAGMKPVVVVAMLANKPGADPGSQARFYDILGLQDSLITVTLQDIKDAIMSRNHAALMKMVKYFDVNTGDTRLGNRYALKDINNPLALAILIPDPESVRILLEAGADTHQKVYGTVTTNGKQETIEASLYQFALAMHEAKKHTRAGFSYSKIINHMSIHHVYTEAEQKRIDQYRAQQRAEEERQFQEHEAILSAQYSQLYDAIRAGDLATVRQVIEHKKIDINFAEFEMGYSTPLMTAIIENKIEIVEYLLKNNADVSIATSEGVDAMHLSCGKGRLEIVKLLVAHGANVNGSIDTEGRGALDLAIGSGNIELVKYLLSKGADLNAAQKRSGNLLYFAVQSKNLAMVRFLIDTGLDVNTKHKYGKTPMDVAVEHNYGDIVSFLITKGAKRSSELPAR